MRVLFDKSASDGLARYLAGHAITKAEELGWGRLENGALPTAVEEAGFAVFLTEDKNVLRLAPSVVLQNAVPIGFRPH
jgi:hypothetical protein